MKRIIRFGKTVKLNPRYIGTFKVIKDVDLVAYRLALPPVFSGVHPVFHISVIKRYHGDRYNIIKWDSVLLDIDLTYKENK